MNNAISGIKIKGGRPIPGNTKAKVTNTGISGAVRVERHLVEVQRVQSLVDGLKPLGNPLRHGLTERKPRAGQMADRRAVARVVDEVAV